MILKKFRRTQTDRKKEKKKPEKVGRKPPLHFFPRGFSSGCGLSSVSSPPSNLCVSMSIVVISHGSSLTMATLGDGGRFLDAVDTELEDSGESGFSQDL